MMLFYFILAHLIKSIINIVHSISVVKNATVRNTSLSINFIFNKYLIIIPIFNEHEIISDLIHKSLSRVEHQKIDIIIVTHITQKKTIEFIKKELNTISSTQNIQLMINDKDDFSKAGQLTYVLNNIDILKYNYISIYDCDSMPDLRAMAYIDANNIQNETHHVFQQIPFYPHVKGQNIFQTIALTRNIHSLNYSYSCELITFEKSVLQKQLRMSTHLLGHGEHMSYDTIKIGGGFNPPFCDSALGFSLSFKNVPIHMIPYPDISTSPTSIKDSYQQGIRWYAGCDLYWREYRLLSKKTHQASLKLLLTLVNNIRWSTPFLFFILLIFSNHVIFFSSIIMLILLIRHMILLKAYNQLIEISKNDDFESEKIYPFEWIKLYIPYLIMRFIWSIVPFEYYIRKLFNKPYKKIPTPKKRP